jgi:hypothetical protein
MRREQLMMRGKAVQLLEGSPDAPDTADPEPSPPAAAALAAAAAAERRAGAAPSSRLTTTNAVPIAAAAAAAVPAAAAVQEEEEEDPWANDSDPEIAAAPLRSAHLPHWQSALQRSSGNANDATPEGRDAAAAAAAAGRGSAGRAAAATAAAAAAAAGDGGAGAGSSTPKPARKAKTKAAAALAAAAAAGGDGSMEGSWRRGDGSAWRDDYNRADVKHGTFSEEEAAEVQVGSAQLWLWRGRELSCAAFSTAEAWWCNPLLSRSTVQQAPSPAD